MSYGEIAVPKKRKKYRYEQKTLGALDRRNQYVGGGTVELENIDTDYLPWLKAARSPRLVYGIKDVDGVLDVLAADGKIYVLVYADELQIYLYIISNGEIEWRYFVCKETSYDNLSQYRMVRFNQFTSLTDPVDGKYLHKILVLPGFYVLDVCCRKSISHDVDALYPDVNKGVVFSSRLFCAGGGKVYASNFNEFTKFEFDTADEAISSNAWMSSTQSNTKSGGDITAISLYDGHVVVFKENYMHQIYNNKNPFRIVDIGEFGCISDRGVCTFSDKLAFVSLSGVMLYGGGYPYCISDELGIDDFSGSIICATDNKLYLYMTLQKKMFVYAKKSGCWSTRDVDNVFLLFSDGMNAYYVTTDDYGIYMLDSDEPGNFYIRGDYSTLGKNGAKRLSELGILLGISDGAEVEVNLRDDADNITSVFSTDEPGVYFVEKKISRSPAYFTGIEVRGSGEVSIGDVEFTFESEGGCI